MIISDISEKQYNNENNLCCNIDSSMLWMYAYN